ncbi:MAG: glycosyltransferase family 4 protein [Actinobacteria bacterium]|nr:glycosyltransferase family 4 protein [Actinomycetota bacterium]
MSDPLRVTLDVSAIPAQPAGAGVYVRQTVEALAAGGEIELGLVAATGDAARWRRLAPGAEVHAEVPARRPARLLWEQTRAPALARRLGGDLWHGPHYTMPVRADLPTVVTIHDLTFFDHPEWHERAKLAYFRRMIRISAKQADLLICVSQHTARRLDAVLTPSSPVEVIPHGVDHDRFRPAPPHHDLELLASLGVRPPFLAFAGTLEPRKNVPALVRAFGELAPAHPELQLVLAGTPGWGVGPIHAAVAMSNVADRIVELGYTRDEVVPALFRQASVVVYPSLEEGFGLPALEALACGAALVTTSGSAMEDVTAGAALLVPPGDDDALAEATEAALAGGDEIDRLRGQGPRVAAEYSWERGARRHVEAYRKAVSAAQ